MDEGKDKSVVKSIDYNINKKQNPMSNIIRDRNGRERFTCEQRYMIPINEQMNDGSVTTIKIVVSTGELVQKFQHSFRRWLIANSIPIVQYCYEAQLEEFVCGNLPEQK